MPPKVHVEPTYVNLSEHVARAIATIASNAIRERGVFSLVLSGGQTPARVYDDLSRLAVDWTRTDLFWSDERCVEPESLQSNFHMVKLALLEKIAIKPDHVHRIKAELESVPLAARLYEDDVRAFFAHHASDRPCAFDLILLGIGEEGHTASLFPAAQPQTPSGNLIQAVWVRQLNAYRITMTVELIKNAREIFILASGPTKAEIVGRVLNEPFADTYPIQKIRPCAGQVTWFVDQDSARDLRTERK
jgi:6-phosphogluconolactonase